MVHEIDSKYVQQAIANNPLVLGSFGAEWCIDCRRAEPFYKKFSEEYSDVFFAKVNVGDRDGELRQQLREQYQFGHIPTMIFYKNGQEVDRIVEVQTPSELKAFIEKCKA